MVNTPHIITLTTDFGTSDVYVGVMKGVILNINPQAQIIDITHDVSHQNIHEAAFTINAAYRYFPKGTIHVIVVDPGVGSNRQAIVCKTENAVFVCPNNGVLTYLLQNIETETNNHKPNAVIIENPTYHLPQVSNTFHGRDIFAPVAAHLSRGVSLSQIGTPIQNIVQLPIPTVKSDNDILTGEIIKIDSFGNLTTNISEDVLTSFLFSSAQNNTHTGALCKHADNIKFEIKIDSICLKKLNSSYAESAVGEPLAIINSFGLLEIAINTGNAEACLGVKIGDNVVVNRSG
ncbi:MAG: SAM-dependent chlorinase/fluorinase [Candidatus Poribacteria bacterium]|nr:SAM-dependent chlorinase/fluorinase [Candidatus Poribacteria bacterium]